jgi:putative transposase
VQQAVDFTGMTDIPVEDRTVLLSDNGAGYISQQFNQYLRLVGIKHITASPFHPQTNGKIERYHRTIKREINQVPYEMPGELKEAIKAFIEYYNYRRYHEGLANVTPWDVYTGRHHEIILTRKEVKIRTLQERRGYNRTARKEGRDP